MGSSGYCRFNAGDTDYCRLEKRYMQKHHARFELRTEEPGEDFVGESAIVVKASCHARVI